jgi:hypothetical protein
MLTEKDFSDFNQADKMTPEIEAAVRGVFNYQPWSMEMEMKANLVREALANAVLVIVEQVPPGPDRTTAIRKIREARMDCNSAINHGGKY